MTTTPSNLQAVEQSVLARHGQPLEVDECLYVSLGGACAPTAVFVAGLHAQVRQVTDRAVSLQAFDDRGALRGPVCWFPRKAFVEAPISKPGSILGARLVRTFSLARWFRPDSYAARFLERNQITGGSSL